MNKFAMAVATASLLLSSHSQAATVIQDVFWGAGVDGEVNTGDNVNLPAKSGDVYDLSQPDPLVKSKLDIDSVEATLTQNLLAVVIKSSLYFSSYLKPLGDVARVSDAPGDLFLSTTGWSPAGNATNHYGTDDSTNGTTWNYVISLSDIYNDNTILSGGAILYKTADGDIGYGSSRTAQEVYASFDGDVTSYGTGNWSYIKEATGEMSLLITMDLSELLGIDWDGKSALGFHFTMDCGNDVIEGSIAPVPLPSACLLLGSALVGLMGVARRRIR